MHETAGGRESKHKLQTAFGTFFSTELYGQSEVNA